MPAARLAAIFRSSSANRYGGMRARRSLGFIQLPDQVLAELGAVHGHGPAGQLHIQLIVDLDLELTAVEADGHRRVSPAQDVGDGGTAGARARRQRLPHPALEDPRPDGVAARAGHRREPGNVGPLWEEPAVLDLRSDRREIELVELCL